MKTFEEALATQVRETTPQNSDSVSAELEDTHARYNCLVEDARNSKALAIMCIVWIDVVAEELGIEQALMSAFMTGLITGIEMEKP